MPCCGWPWSIARCLRWLRSAYCRALSRQRAARYFLACPRKYPSRRTRIPPGNLAPGSSGRRRGTRCAALRHPAPRSCRKRAGPRTLPQGAPYGRRRSKPTVSGRVRLSAAKRTVPHVVRNPDAIRCAHHILRPPAPASRARHATAKGRACRRCGNSLPPTNGAGLRIAIVLTYLPVVVAPSGEAFRGIQGAGCLSEAEGVASSAPPAKSLGARETPARAAGRGRGSRACFLVTCQVSAGYKRVFESSRGGFAATP